MGKYKIKVADCVVEIEDDDHSEVFFRDFITEENEDLKILKTNKKYRTNERYPGKVLDWEEKVSIEVFFERLYDALIEYNTFLMHGAVIGLHGNAYMFSGKSGIGKTTHILKWLEQCPDAFAINGDKPLIKVYDDGTPPYAYSSPWCGKEKLYTNTKLPLKAIVFMERAQGNHIEKISFIQAFPLMLEQVYRPANEEKMRKTLRMLQKLNGVNFFRFKCNNFKDDCFDVTYHALTGDEE